MKAEDLLNTVAEIRAQLADQPDAVLCHPAAWEQVKLTYQGPTMPTESSYHQAMVMGMHVYTHPAIPANELRFGTRQQVLRALVLLGPEAVDAGAGE